MKDNYQLETWTGRFGDGYTARNKLEDWKMPYGVKAFQRMIGDLYIKSVLEVGSNTGLNLYYINEVFNGRLELHAVEPNKKAYLELQMGDIKGLRSIWDCDASDLPYRSLAIDLVFTSGVLIHIHPDNLDRAMDEIVRVAKRYVLCIEYFSHKPTSEQYRHQNSLLFKRDFGSYYLDRFSNLKCIRNGFLWQMEWKVFDNMNWWLFEKELK